MRKPILFLSIVCVFFSCTDQKNIVENEVDMSLTKYVNPFVGTSGFYPICPSSNIYSIGSPGLEAVEMTLYNCKKVRVTTENYSKENVYIQSMTLNGKPYNKTYLTYDDIKNGADIKFVLGKEPNKQWGSADDSVAPSLSKPGQTLKYKMQ